MQTYQDIVDAREALGKEFLAEVNFLREEHRKKLTALQEKCGFIGHVYSIDSGQFASLRVGRTCPFCQAVERNAKPGTEKTNPAGA